MHFDLPKEGSRHVEARSIPSDFRPISRSNRFLSLVLYLASATLCLWNGRTHAAGTIQDLIDSAPPGTKVTLHAATYFEHGIIIRSDLILEGEGATQTVIDAQKLGRPFHVLPGAKLELRGVTIQNGLSGVGSDGNGLPGGAILNEGTLIATDCNLIGNATSAPRLVERRSGDGGAIYSSGLLELSHCIVKSNAVNVYNYEFGIGTQIQGHGGGIFNAGTASIQNVEILGNRVAVSTDLGISGQGGAIFNQSNSVLTVWKCTFQENSSGGSSSSSGNGGAISNHGELVIEQSSFLSNRTGQIMSIIGGGAGAALANNGKTKCINTVFRGNSTSPGGPGGAIHNAGVIVLRSCQIEGNVGGNGSFRTYGGNGGGIAQYGGEVVMEYCLIQSNSVGRLASGGGIFVDDGVFRATNTQVLANSTGLSSAGAGNGAGVCNLKGDVIFVNSAINDNLHPSTERSELLGGGIFNSRSLQLLRCTISRNSVQGACPSSIFPEHGAGICNSDRLEMMNCTVSSNFIGLGCPRPGGGAAGILNTGFLSLSNCTITGNETGPGWPGGVPVPGGSGGGILNRSNATVEIYNSIIAGNRVANGGKGPDIFGTVISKGHNLIGSTSDMEIQGDLTSNILNVDPHLGPLQDNGGPTWTHALLPNSPAINSGDPSLTGTDQRGVARPAGAGTDIGAFESDGSGPPPSIELLAPSFITLCSGKDLTIQARGFGTPPFTYQWRQNEQPLPSATSNILSLLNVTTNASGIYDVILSDRWGSVTSKVTSITILPPLQILREPVSLVVVTNGRAVFKVEATGSGLLPFRWFKDGVIIRNQIQPELVIEPATVADEGVYQVRVGDACSTYLSSNVVLRVIEPTVITHNPESISVELGAPARFAVEARGVDPLHYQWFRGSDPQPIPGATHSILEIASVTPEDETVYQVSISNLAGVIESIPARLTLLRHPLVINIQGAGRIDRTPDQISYFLGTPVQLEAVADRYWRFVGWEDGGTASIRSVTVRPGVEFAATFELTRPLETLSVGGVSRTAPAGMPALVIEDKLVADTNHFMRGQQFVKLISSLPNASLTYTLDGTEPNLLSTLYQGPFLVKTDAVVRVIAYSGDFTESVLGEPTTLHVLPVLNAYTAGGGNVQVDPPAGAYDAESTARVTATPDSGWKFLEWLGDAEGSDLSVVIPMTQNRVVEAVFGGRFSTNVAGFGTIHRHPDMDWYPYGTAVRLTAIPERGNGFAFWGASLNTTSNPVTLVITQSIPIITAVFTPLTSGDVVTLSVISDGGGKTQVTPISNRYAKGSKVTLTATPDSGQEFVGWSGDITNVTNPWVVVLDQSVELRAKFSSRPRISLAGPLGGRFGRFTRLQIESAPGMVLSVESSADLVEWRALGKLTNTWGRTTWTDRSTDGVGHNFYKLTVAE